MGIFFSKTKSIEEKNILKILSLRSNQIALLSKYEIEIISKDTLETDLIIKGNNYKNISQLKNNYLVSLKENINGLDIISLQGKNNYQVEQTLDINALKLLEVKNDLFFLRSKILVFIYTFIRKIPKKILIKVFT